MEISKEMAELVGIILGDGHVHKNKDTVVISGSKNDRIYYEHAVLPLIKKALGIDATIYFQENRNACYLSINSEKAVSKIIKIGFKRGKKKFHFSEYIKHKNLYPHILRGIFDTDGCLKFSKQTKELNYYPRLQFALRPSNFSDFISVMLNKLSFNYGKWVDDNSRGYGIPAKLLYYHISGKQNLEKWMKKVGSSNPVHITKYLYWKKYGHYKPRTSLQERCDKLDIEKTKDVIVSPVL